MAFPLLSPTLPLLSSGTNPPESRTTGQSSHGGQLKDLLARDQPRHAELSTALQS